MKRNTKYIILGLLMTIGIGIPVILYTLSPTLNGRTNGFTRKFSSMSDMITLVNVITKTKDFSRLAGATSSKLYFSSYNPGIVASSDLTLGHLQYDTLEYVAKNGNYGAYQIRIDSPYYVILNGNTQQIKYGLYSTKKTLDTICTAFIYTKAIYLQPSTFVLRGFITPALHDQEFAKINPPHALIKGKGLTEQLGDAGFATDGVLLYDSATATIVYTHYYLSQILLLDTNFRIKKRIHTIDTLSTIATKAGVTFSNNYSITRISNTTPRYFINQYSSVCSGLIYVSSMIKADNEPSSDFDNHTVIDIYDILTGKYIESFHVPNYNHQRMKQFNVYAGRLIAFYRDYVVCYSLRNTGHFPT